MSWLAWPVSFWRISSGTSALAIAELKLCRSEWNDSRETLRSSFPSFLRATVVDAGAFHQSLECHAESRFPGSRLIEKFGEDRFFRTIGSRQFQKIFVQILMNLNLNRGPGLSLYERDCLL